MPVSVQDSTDSGSPRSSGRKNSLRKAVKKLGARSTSRLRSLTSSDNTATTPTSASSNPDSNSRGHRRLLSKGGRRSEDIGASCCSSSLSRRIEDNIARTSMDDSPFITPPSPPIRPSLAALGGEASMRAGTQALIQALQAVPWEDDDEAQAHHRPSSSSDDEVDSAEAEAIAALTTNAPLSSSIHAIHRPIAQARRGATPAVINNENVDSYFPQAIVEEPEDEVHDFEETPVLPTTLVHTRKWEKEGEGNKGSTAERMERMAMSRMGSMATVRVMRRAKLAEKLRDVFELDAIEEVIAELPCWLLRSVLLQGYMYLTNSYLCFFAHMPSREDQILKSGSMNKKTARTKRWNKYWFVLKNDVLSWYQSSSDPYFPRGVVDLRYAITCEPSGEREIRLRTHQKGVTLSADSAPAREEWLKAIRKVIFKAQNLGESVRIAIPYTAIVDVERSTAIDFSETVEVKVLDRHESHSLDSYFFAYFKDLQGALAQIKAVVEGHRTGDGGEKDEVIDTTAASGSFAPSAHHPATQNSATTSTPSRLGSILSKITESAPSLPYFRSSSNLANSPSRTPVSLPPERILPPEHLDNRPGPSPQQQLAPHQRMIAPDSDETLHGAQSIGASADHTYPPRVFGGERIVQGHAWTLPVPSWFKKSNKEEVSEVLSPGVVDGVGVSVLDNEKGVDDEEVVEKFRTVFAFDQKESLLGCEFPSYDLYVESLKSLPDYVGYLFRVLPVSGKFYISENYLCFRSSGLLTTKTRLVLPLRDILNTEMTKGFRFGHYGLTVIIRGYEELFFEFGSSEKRASFQQLINKLIESNLDPDKKRKSTEKREDTLEELELSKILSDSAAALGPGPGIEVQSEALPAVMFTSQSSTFLTFKPTESLHFTLLTIGSRGDVQPYIALGKGLIKDGHRVRIATHGEFKEWIESQGIEFGYVGGDPAELMRICVENGMFTLSFMKEGVQKFRGWIDDLLRTAYEACKGTDVLIESPSAMAGLHIAEALRIPYFRAFTMPWTRTRAYPHSFAVAERKMGGGYNYMTYVMFDQVFWRATSGQINRWRKQQLNLPPTNLDRMEQHKVPFLYNFSPSVVPPPLDWYEWIRVTGYWFLEDADVSAKKWSPPEDLVKFIDDAHAQNKKVVYIGFGSIVVSDPESMTKAVVEAILQSGVHAIVSKGWSDRLHKKGEDGDVVPKPDKPLPPQIYNISSVPHDWLFPRIDAACHHGGAGTTGASLRAGIPTIIKPFFGDQFFWSDRVEALGLGSSVRKLTVESLTEALLTATTDEKQISRAKLIGAQVRAENGVATAIEAIYRDLEYARTLVHRNYHEGTPPVSPRKPLQLLPPSSPEPHAQQHPRPSMADSADLSTAPASNSDWSVVSDGEVHEETQRNKSPAPRTSSSTMSPKPTPAS